MPEPLRPHDPDRIGPYTIESRLGAGGMGTVFLGRTVGGYRVAVKVAKQEISDDDGFRRRFATEVHQASKVTGLYTAAVVNSDVDAEQPWVATEFVDAPTLAEYVQRHGSLPVAVVARIGAGIAEGLEDIHGKDILHRDLKPQNVLVTENGPKVIDFGIARALDETSHTPESRIVGTAAYMSPEQARGDADVDGRSDLFAFGAVLYFAAVGRSLWGLGRPLEILHRVAYEEPDLSAVTDSRLRVLIRSCLAKSPRDRPDLGSLRGTLGQIAGPGGGPPGTGATEVISPERMREDPAEREHSPAPPVDATPPVADPALAPTRRAVASTTPTGPDITDPPVERCHLTTGSMRAARTVTYLGRIALLPLAVLAGAALFQLFGYGQRSPADIVTYLTPFAVLLLLVYLTTRSRPRIHDRIDLSIDGFRLVDRRLLRLRNKTRFFAWIRMEQVRLVVEDDLYAVVGRFPDGSTAPLDLLGPDHTAYRHRHGHVLTWFRVRTPEQAATARQLHGALERTARDLYVPERATRT